MEVNTALNVFIVDDDCFCLTIYEQHIRNLGIQNLSVFTDGMACINNLALQPDIVFVDYNMDGLNGMEVLKKIKSSSPGTYVVLVSGQEDVQVAVDALSHGAFDYIVKGANNTTRIEGVLSKISEARELQIRNRNNAVF